MTYETISVDEDRITTITLDRPDSKNGLSPQLCRELQRVLDHLDEVVRVVILRGAGDNFSAGGDINELVDTEDEEAKGWNNYEYIDKTGHALVRKLRDLHVPVVAAVSGVAVGAGCNLALGCDIIVCDESATFGQVFRNIGLHPDTGGTYFLPREVGYKKACELIFTGEMIDAEEAAEIGMVNRLVPQAKLGAAVEQLAERIADGPPIAMKLAKESIYENASADLDVALNREALVQSYCLSTDEFEEGVAAFSEGRDPEFSD